MFLTEKKEREARKPLHIAVVGLIEIPFIVFLFYANLLMGEYERSSPADKTLLQGLANIFTYKNFGIAMATALVGFVVFEGLRRAMRP